MNKRNICITDCTTFEDYVMIMQILEGYTPPESERKSVLKEMRADPLLFDDGKKQYFMFFWNVSKTKNFVNCRQLTCEEFYKEFYKELKNAK